MWIFLPFLKRQEVFNDVVLMFFAVGGRENQRRGDSRRATAKPAELGLPDQERPYYIGAYMVSDEVSYAQARFGALMEKYSSAKKSPLC